ncbi:MAG TPA: anaerobic ribonucleoside-triphosphate reductase activating protein [Flavobacterium sp.]|uniref:anaerobic ribonucleoside-triphosphate reductase activating protein n=1 Tax=Flavobacterium sp. TaxID=239 RepID=UPI002B7D51D8|nr:anaerobic ribonucleoside-triphosphate reductase activating protein [Flavobacterium sp.]HSD14933.1 anaerobic ribonucleoside-triphosphate reductase activating protein [Flavobacterium sp.]
MNTVNAPILWKENAAKAIFSITPFSLLDYPHKSACILWFTGCNMRCLYCYNPEIVLGKGKISFDEALTFLATRKKLLDAVVLSGGECTMHKNLIRFAREIKAMGFDVKIDTNGSNPSVLEELIVNNLVDYVALDFKATEMKFREVTQANLFLAFETSLHLLLQNKIHFEVRTTFHSDLIDELELHAMVCYLENKKYSGNYYVQHFVNNVETIGDLPRSSREIENGFFSTEMIKVNFRG